MRPDTHPQIVELADSAKAEVANVIAEIGEDDPAREGRQDTRFQSDATAAEQRLERFRAKWIPVRVKKTRQIKK